MFLLARAYTDNSSRLLYLFRLIPDSRRHDGALVHKLNHKEPCSLSNGEVFSSPLPSGARRQHPPRSTTAAISRKQGGWQITPALTKGHWPGVVCWPDRMRCPPLRLCTVMPEDCHYTDRRASSLPEYLYLPAHCLISPGNRLIYGMEPY